MVAALTAAEVRALPDYLLDQEGTEELRLYLEEVGRVLSLYELDVERRRRDITPRIVRRRS